MVSPRGCRPWVTPCSRNRPRWDPAWASRKCIRPTRSMPAWPRHSASRARRWWNEAWRTCARSNARCWVTTIRLPRCAGRSCRRATSSTTTHRSTWTRTVRSSLIPADLPPELLARVQRMAVTAFQAIECWGMARVDFFVRGKDGLINEINTIPGFTSISMYPKLWEASGLAYPDLVERLIELAIERHAAERAKGTTARARTEARLEPLSYRCTTGQVRVRVMPSTAWMRATTSLPSSSTVVGLGSHDDVVRAGDVLGLGDAADRRGPRRRRLRPCRPPSGSGCTRAPPVDLPRLVRHALPLRYLSALGAIRALMLAVDAASGATRIIAACSAIEPTPETELGAALADALPRGARWTAVPAVVLGIPRGGVIVAAGRVARGLGVRSTS